MTTSSRAALTFVMQVIVIAIFISMVAGMPAGGQSKKKEEKKTESPRFAVFGRDTRPFVDAGAMFVTSTQAVCDDSLGRTILSALAGATQGRDPLSGEMWAQLDRLRAQRVSDRLIIELQEIAKELTMANVRPAGSRMAASKKAFDKGNEYYEAGRFDKAIESYRAATKGHPAYWDAWNNMALAETHEGSDLVALYLLSALTKNNPQYVGGFINLAVCLERLGLESAAYGIAAAVASTQPRMPMAHYNLSWFQNARGRYDSAQARLTRVLDSVPDYGVAKWLHVVNSMESGRGITSEELKTLSRSDQHMGIPSVESRQVLTTNAGAYSGDSMVARIPGGAGIVISEISGEWCAFYWPVDGVKRRLWIHKSSLSTADNLGVFVGTWTGRWAEISETVKIEAKGGQPSVSLFGHGTTSDEKLENGKLSFRAIISGSGWEFVYTLKPVPDGLEMDVFRVRDSKRFSGKLTKN